MSDIDQTNPEDTPNGTAASPEPSNEFGDRKVVQPIPEPVQVPELQPSPQQSIDPSGTAYAQPSQQPQPAQPQPTAPRPTFPQPAVQGGDQMQGAMSASQMGFNQPKTRLMDFNVKVVAVKVAAAILTVAILLIVLVATNILTLGQFKTIKYMTSKGTKYSLTFYAKHTTKSTTAGSTQLISKVSKDGKFPLALSIADGTDSGYQRAKDCVGFTKLFDVQNDNLKQKITVCNYSFGQNVPNGVYVAGIKNKDKTAIVTISQDLTSADLSNPITAKNALPKFGIDPYQDDIKQIIASIKAD